MINQFTREQKEKFSSNPVISRCRNGYFFLTEEFYHELYVEWHGAEGDYNAIQKALEKNGIFPSELRSVIAAVADGCFSRYGEPTDGKDHPMTNTHTIQDQINDIALVMSGVYTLKGKGIGIRDDIFDHICVRYPEDSLEDIFSELGLETGMVSKGRKNAIKIRITKTGHGKREQTASSARTFSPKEKEPLPVETASEETADKTMDTAAISDHGISTAEVREDDGVSDSLADNPYVRSFSGFSVEMTDSFYNSAKVLEDLSLSRILEIYGVRPDLVSERSRQKIRAKLTDWIISADPADICRPEDCAVMIRKLKAMTELSEMHFSKIREIFGRLSPPEKKRVCGMVSEYPVSEDFGYSRRLILEKCGIPKTLFYKALSSASYGRCAGERQEQDDRDIALIRQVLSYRGFRKGTRQVYMLLPDITGEHFAMSKIRRLMDKYGIKTGIRRSKRSVSRDAMLTVRNRKENLLSRRFRLAHPNEIRLTDVTYLNYGGHKRAYASSCIDPVTGRLIAFNTSEHNDLPLAMETLERLKNHPAIEGALFHSDQGILYMTDEFQNRVKELGFKESMSERGICFDNAPQESFFGHFKDEVPYGDCETYEEVKGMIEEYAVYYNNERRQWDRKQMTPVEYEKYMLSLTEEEYAAYLQTETEAYKKMQAAAAEKAVRRAQARKAAIEAAYGGTDE